MDPVAVLAHSVGLFFLASGLIAWYARPHNRVGPLMTLVGVLWFPQRMDEWVDGLPRWALMSISTLWASALAHLILAFPTGRLGSRHTRVLAAASYVTAVVLGVNKAVRIASQSEPGFDLGAWTWVCTLLTDLENPVTAALGLAVLVLKVVQWRRSSVTQRRAITPFLATSAIGIVLFSTPLYKLGLDENLVDYLVLSSLAAVPVGYLVGLLRQRFDQAGVADLVVRLNEESGHDTVETALAATLHDPDLRVGYWVPDQERYVDSEGEPIALPPAPERVTTRLDRGGAPVAVLVHDPVLMETPELIDAACAAAALAIDNERLAAELRARLRQLDASRRRVVQAGEVERRRLERDLHDGVQQRLLSVAMTLGLAEQLTAGDPEQSRVLIKEAKESVLATLAELRALSHGIHPPVLTERGLPGAVRELAAVVPGSVELRLEVDRSLPQAVETTAYYLVAEALANAVKHANAGSVRVAIVEEGDHIVVEVEDDGVGGADAGGGSGLRGLADRVEANRGELHVTSTPGVGTRLRAVLPCS